MQNILTNILFSLIAFIATTSSIQAIASSEGSLEQGLLEAFTLSKDGVTRVGDSGKAIQAYMRKGVVNKKPNLREDYTDYYLVNKPAKFMGHDLKIIEEEYLLTYIGCCVNPGAGITVKINGSTKSLKKFAKSNGCTLTEDVDFQQELHSFGIKAKRQPGSYASLSCRERDIHH